MTTGTPTTHLRDFRVLTFDVVGTLIDFETAITGGLERIGAAAGVTVDPETALSHYRAARYEAEAGLFPDDLARCYTRIAPKLGLPDTPENADAMVAALGTAAPFADSVDALAALGRRFRLIAMTNARRWAFDLYAARLGNPFDASFTVDETGCEKPDPAYFGQVIDHVAGLGHGPGEILHVAQSQYHDIGPARRLGLTSAWIERRAGRAGYGGTIAPEQFTEPEHHFHSLGALAAAVEASFDATRAEATQDRPPRCTNKEQGATQ